jgi:hypothetical protein
MKWRLGIFIVIALIILAIGLADAWPFGRLAWWTRSPDPLDASFHSMPMYRPPRPVDPRMPVLDSVLPLSRDSNRHRAPHPRGWLRP